MKYLDDFYSIRQIYFLNILKLFFDPLILDVKIYIPTEKEDKSILVDGVIIEV